MARHTQGGSVGHAPDDEAKRLIAVREFASLLEGAGGTELDDLAGLAASVCAAPMAAITFIDEEKQHFKAKTGLNLAETSRSVSFCAHAILGEDLFVVSDASSDCRFAANALVTGQPRIQFYAGAPLVMRGGETLGALCVLDIVPRTLAPEQAVGLRALGRQVVSRLELLRLRSGEELKTRIIESSRDCVKVLDLDANLLSMNAGGMAVLEIADLQPVLNSCWLDFWQGADREAAVAAVETARAGGVGRFVGFFATVQTQQPRWWHVVVSALTGADGKPEKLVAVSRDVTDWKRSEQERLRAEARERAILEVNNAIISNLTQETLLRAISQALFRVVPFDRAALTLYDAPTDQLRVLALEGRLPPRNYPIGVALDRKDSHVGWVFDHQRTLLRRHLETEREFGPEHRLYDEGIRSLCTAPLVLAGKSIGTITLGSTTTGHFTEVDELFLRDVSNQVALAISNMRAFEEIAALKARLQAENLYLREEIRGEHNYSEIVGKSAPLLEILSQIDQVAPTDATVLVLGETGTGKELVARAIHDRSKRKDRPLVKVNCGAISAGLVESELFGHVKGAFTGALGNRDGRFKLADGGTIFLDEVSELPLDTQVKLLRVLQEQEFEPVGSSKSIKVDVRVIAATNRDLAAAVGAGKFRGDLFYRLNVVPISVPALRDRAGDVELLAEFFVQKFAKKVGRPALQIPSGALQRLRAYSWPGNIRELQNVIERAVVLAQNNTLALAADFAPPSAPALEIVPSRPEGAPSSTTNTLDDVERSHIESVLMKRNWMIEGDRGAAKALNIHPNTLRSRMRRLGLKRPGGPTSESDPGEGN